MARTWTLVDTISNTLLNKFIAGSGSTVYFFTNTVVYSWQSASGPTDISDSTFAGSSIKDICLFQDNLYVAYTYNINNEMRVARWDGGTSWSVVFTLFSSDQSAPGVYSSSGRAEVLDADNDKIVVRAQYDYGPGNTTRLAASSNGTTWVMQTVEGLSGPPGTTVGDVAGNVYGLSKGSSYSVVISVGLGSVEIPSRCEISGEGDWVMLNPGTRYTTPNPTFVGFANGYAFYVATFGSTYIGYSTNWAETNPASAGITGTFNNFIIMTIVPGVTMAATTTNNQAYVLDGNQFVADGTIDGGRSIKAYFRIGSTLYLLATDGTHSYIYGADGTLPIEQDRRLYIYRTESDGVDWTSKRVVTNDATDFRIGGLSHNSADIDADGLYLYLAVLNSSDRPQILKMLANLTADATVSYNPGGGSEVNVMAGDLSPYFVWATGAFAGTDKVVKTEDGIGWYVQDEGDWVGVARPILVGPGDDGLVTTSTGLSFRQTRYEGDILYWIERYIPGTIWAVDRVDDNFDQTVIGAYWYSGDSSELIHYSPNSGFDWENVTDALTPPGIVTSLIIGH